MSYPGTKNRTPRQQVAGALQVAGLSSAAGDLFDLIQLPQKALLAYTTAHNYRRALEVARTALPKEVVRLEEAWGDYLMGQKQMDSAINHYIEAGCAERAIQVRGSV